MTGRLSNDQAADVTPNAAPRRKGKFSFFRRLVLTLVFWVPVVLAHTAWRAFTRQSHPDSTFLWEFGYQVGSTSPLVWVGSFLIGWLIIPLAFTPDR